MANQQLEAIGVHGQESPADILRRPKAKGHPSGSHPFCQRHGSHFCPCVRPEMYRPGDKRGDPALWDKAVEDRRAKDAAKREEARLEYEERQRDEATG